MAPVLTVTGPMRMVIERVVQKMNTDISEKKRWCANQLVAFLMLAIISDPGNARHADKPLVDGCL